MIFLFSCVSTPKEPVVHQISFQGNGGYWSETNDENLRSAMKQKTNQNLAFLSPDLWMSPYESQTLKKDAKRIELWYAHHGYFDAKFQGWNISTFPSIFSSYPHLSIEGVVEEGEPALVRGVYIDGDMYGTLKKQIRRVNSIKRGDVFSMEDIEDLEYAIGSFLQAKSYARPKIESQVLVWPEACSELKYHKGKCQTANVKAHCQDKCGQHTHKIEDCRETCTSLIQKMELCEDDGSCFTKLAKESPYLDFLHREEGTVVDLLLNINPGPSYRFGRIHLKGETTIPLEPVLDKILIEAEVTPGSRFTMEKIYEAQEALYNMGLFSVVNILPRYEEDVGLAHLDIELTQTSFGDLNLGVGAEYDLGNFGINILGEVDYSNLWNRLIQVHWKNELGYAWLPQNIGDETFQSQHGFVGTSQLRFLVPNLYRSYLSFDTVVFNEWGMRPGYQFGFLALNPSLQYLLPIPNQKSNFCTLRLGYEISYRNYFNVTPTLRDSLFPYLLSSIQQELILDGRDHNVYTKGGQYLSTLISRNWPILGTSTAFTKLSFEHRMYGSLNALYELPIGKKKLRGYLKSKKINTPELPITFAFRWSSGVILTADEPDSVPFDDRFLLGGGNDVRGWRLFHLGPYICRDETQCLSNGSQLSQDILPQGGNFRFFGNLEARYYTPAGYGLVLFFDGGRVWPTFQDMQWEQLQYSAGIGFRYKSSIGPFRFDIARRMSDDVLFQEEPRWALHLALSESF